MARGGRRPGAGRPANAKTKATADLKAAASEYTIDMLKVLVSIATESESPAARVAAAVAVLDRGHGKPTQTIAGDRDNPLLVPVLNVTIGSRKP